MARVGRAPGALVSLGLAVVVLALGVVVGVAEVAVHEWWPMLVVGAAAALATALALPRAWWSRPPFAAGVAGVVALGALPRSEGDYLVGADAPGWTLLAVTMVLVVLTVATLPRRRWAHEVDEPTGPERLDVDRGDTAPPLR